MKLLKVSLLLFVTMLISCDDKELSDETNNNRLKSGLNDSTSVFDIVVDSSFTDTVIVKIEE